MPKLIYPWGELVKKGDSFVLNKPTEKKRNSCRFSGMQQGKRLKIYSRPNGDYDVVFVEFVQEWYDKYKSNVVQ